MKITNAEVEALREAISRGDSEAARQDYRDGNFPRSAAVNDLDKRYRWDLFFGANGMSLLKGEYNDSHIDTALRSIVPPLNQE